MSFADAIIKLRSERRISQKELAEDLNVSCATVNRWENGRTVHFLLLSVKSGRGQPPVSKEMGLPVA